MNNLIITGKNFKLTPSLKEYVSKKMNKLDEFSSLRILEAKVELDVDHNQKSGLINRVEASARLPGAVLKAGVKATDMHAAVDLCLPKLIRQVKKYKGKKLSLKKQHHSSLENI